MDGKTDLVILAMLEADRPMGVEEVASVTGMRRDAVRRRLGWLQARGRAAMGRPGKNSPDGAWTLARHADIDHEQESP